MTDDPLIQAAAVAESRLPGGTGKYVAMLLGWEARTWEPFSAHTQIAEKLASAILVLPKPAVDREALGRVIHDAQCICKGGHELQPDDLAAADALISAGAVASEPLPEWSCPACGATTRARMADRQDKEATDVTP